MIGQNKSGNLQSEGIWSKFLLQQIEMKFCVWVSCILFRLERFHVVSLSGLFIFLFSNAGKRRANIHMRGINLWTFLTIRLVLGPVNHDTRRECGHELREIIMKLMFLCETPERAMELFMIVWGTTSTCQTLAKPAMMRAWNASESELRLMRHLCRQLLS